MRRFTLFALFTSSICFLSACSPKTAEVAQASDQPRELESKSVVEARDVSTPASSALTVKPSEGPQLATINVRGMSCPLCAHNIEQQMTKIDGVSNVRIDLGKGQVLADVQNPSEGTEWAMKQAIGDAGFTAIDVQIGRRIN